MFMKPAGHFDGSAQASKASRIGEHAQTATLPSVQDFRRHVIVAGSGRGGEVFHPVLDPFDRLAGNDGGDRRADIARIGADQSSEAAPMSGAIT